VDAMSDEMVSTAELDRLRQQVDAMLVWADELDEKPAPGWAIAAEIRRRLGVTPPPTTFKLLP
jgi:hypothetical protein